MTSHIQFNIYLFMCMLIMQMTKTTYSILFILLRKVYNIKKKYRK